MSISFLIFGVKELIMPNRFWTRGILISSAIILGLTLSSPAVEGFVSMGSGTDKEPWDIEARELSYDKDTDTYTAIGEVVLKKGKSVLKCDYAQVDRQAMIALARGKVEFTSSGDQVSGDEMTVDLKKQTGEVTKGRLFLKMNNFHVTGEQIFKTGESTYRVINATVTSCDGEKVPWDIKAKELVVNVDGYGQAWNPRLRVKDIPFLYSPYVIFPAKTARQSGFLMPEPGQSSRDGFTVDLPFFWAISNNTDATFHEYFMSRRGFMQGAEFRYVLSPLSKGTLMMDYLSKDQVSQEQFDMGNISKPYTERYWFRSKINQELPWKMDLKMDLDWASDRDYVKEFRAAPDGRDRNRLYFLTEFSRDLEDETQINRRNAAIFSKNFGTYSFTGGFNYYQDLDQTGTYLNQLPYARFDSIKQELWKTQDTGKTPLFFQWGASYNNYWRTSGDRGQVAEFTPTVYYPTKLGNYLNLEPSLGVTETMYQVDNKQSDSVDPFGNRTVPNFRWDMSTDIQKIFSFSGGSEGEVQKVKHNIRPQVIYNYIPEIKQDSLPTFISAITKTNTLTYYLINTFTSKSLLKKGQSETSRDELLMGYGEFLDDGSREDLFSYRDFLLFKLYQTYDINAAQSGTTTTAQPFSDVTAEMEFLPSPYLTLRSSAGWSPYSGQMSSQTHNLTVFDKKGNRAYVEYLATSGDQNRQINANLFWKIGSFWSANFLTRYSLDQNTNFETTVGLAYNAQCWGIKFTYTERPDDKVYMISFSLKGLGGI